MAPSDPERGALGRLAEMDQLLDRAQPRRVEPGLGGAPPRPEAPAPPPTRPTPAPPRPAPAPVPKPPLTQPAPPTPAAPSSPARSRRPRRRWLWVLVALVLVGLGALAGGAYYANWRYGQIERVDARVAPAGIGADVWMLVGSDSREGIDPDRPDAARLIGEPVFGQRADSIILVREVPGLGPQMLSLPRDLWLDPPGDDNATRINGAYAAGPDRLLDLVESELGIGVQHYVEIDLAGLDDVIDAVGGVVIELTHPGYDESLGLFLDAGEVRLDGPTGLSFVRSRHWVDVIDGIPVADGRGDLGRVERQQQFLAALGDQLLSTRNPLALHRISGGLTSAVRVDNGTGFRELLSFARQLQHATSAPALPVDNHVTGVGAHVLLLDEGAEDVLGLYR